MTAELSEKIARVCDPALDGWTEPEQGEAMAEAILTLRHPVSVELGVYAAKGLVVMALAHKQLGFGKAIGIDPWLAEASTQGMTPEHAKWWGKLDHDRIYKLAQENLKRYGVEQFAELVRSKSEDAAVPAQIGLLRVDGNHGPRSIIDFRRFAPAVVVGGTIAADDVSWENGPLANGFDEDLYDLGFKKVCEIGTTWVFKRERR